MIFDLLLRRDLHQLDMGHVKLRRFECHTISKSNLRPKTLRWNRKRELDSPAQTFNNSSKPLWGRPRQIATLENKLRSLMWFSANSNTKLCTRKSSGGMFRRKSNFASDGRKAGTLIASCFEIRHLTSWNHILKPLQSKDHPAHRHGNIPGRQMLKSILEVSALNFLQSISRSNRLQHWSLWANISTTIDPRGSHKHVITLFPVRGFVFDLFDMLLIWKVAWTTDSTK